MKPVTLLLGLSLLGLHITCSNAPPDPVAEQPGAPAEESSPDNQHAMAPAHEAAAGRPEVASPASTTAPSNKRGQEDGQPQCIPVFKQTGPGCDLPEIERRLKELRRPAGPVAQCYKRSLSSPRSGTVKLRISLEPSGSVGSVETLQDEFAPSGLSSCLAGEVAALTFPAPGDVPCVVVHTFPFVL